MTQQRSTSQFSRITRVFLDIESDLRRYLMRFLLRNQDIEDLIQETFVKAVNAEKSVTIHSPKSFLFRIARNLALDELAKKSNRLAIHIEDLAGLEVLEDVQSLEDQVGAQQRFGLFCEALSRLPPQCRKAFVMGKILGCSHAEIARHMHISTSTVEKHIAKGLRACQDYMDSAEHTPIHPHLFQESEV